MQGIKMVGIKGKSGRKKRDDGYKMRAVALYVAMTEMDVSHPNDPKGGKYQWIPEAWFRQFKHVFGGSKWQEKTRQIMQQYLKEYERTHMWECECQSRLQKWHKKTEAICYRCDFEPMQIHRFKTTAEVRINNRENPASKVMTKCNCGEPLTLQLTQYGKTYVCLKCNPKSEL